MSTAVDTCTCGSVGADPTKVRLTECHHRYFRGDQELASVSKVLRMWPRDPCSECKRPFYGEHVPGCGVRHNIDNAQERGKETDWLLSEWIAGRISSVPAGMRRDARERFLALQKWMLAQSSWSSHDSQVILADWETEIAGTADLCVNVKGMPWVMDLKNVAAIDPSYHLQLGAYADLYEFQYGTVPTGAAIIHVTQPKDKPVSIKLVEVDLSQARADWKALRAMWDVVQRRSK